MQRLLIFSLAALISGCASTPPTSDIVLMAASHADKKNNNLESSPWACLKFDDTPVDKKQLIETIVDKALEKETGFDKEQRQQVVYLLMSGKFTSDLHDLIALILSLPPTTMNTAPSMGDGFVSLSTDLYGCLTQRQCANPASVINVVNNIYKNPGVELQKETFRALLDNQSFRFALIAYAHANGIDISDEDLTFVQNQLRKDEIDMESLMNEGKQRLKEKYKLAEFEARLACLEQ